MRQRAPPPGRLHLLFLLSPPRRRRHDPVTARPAGVFEATARRPSSSRRRDDRAPQRPLDGRPAARQVSATPARCARRRIKATLGDRDDSLAARARCADADLGAGVDTLIGGDGDDTVAARDGVRDVIACGAGDDTGEADAEDERRRRLRGRRQVARAADARRGPEHARPRRARPSRSPASPSAARSSPARSTS